MASPDEYNRNESEARIASLLSERFVELRQQIERGDAINWPEWELRLKKELEDELAAVFVVLFLMRRNDRSRAAQLASSFASSTSRSLLDTMRNNFRTELRYDLDTQRIFSPSRAETIAATEVTRAIVQGETAARFEWANDDPVTRSGNREGVPPIIVSDGLVAVWQTEEDERVCPVCGPNHNKPATWWADRFPQGPPAHPKCRCWLIYKQSKK